jgi:K+-transporting ATPase ATPase C chain
MRKDLTASAVAIVLCTLVLGLAYPLLTTGVAQLLFPGRADGSRLTRAGKVVGSRLIGQDFAGRPAYFQARPSQTGYAANASGFANLGPNQKRLEDLIRQRIAAYVGREGPYTPGLTSARIPVDAVTNSGSGVDPHISQANARIQANRVASVRHLSVARVRALIGEHTDGRFLGVLGEPGVNVLELNLALDKEAPLR